jgi:uncharacterized membrane protein
LRKVYDQLSIIFFMLHLVAAFVACFFESYVGASLQSGKNIFLTNEVVNVINTLVGAVISIIYLTIVSGGGRRICSGVGGHIVTNTCL